MKKLFAITICGLCWTTWIGHAHAADITLKLNDKEQKALVGLLDLAVRQGGIQVTSAAAYFMSKLTPEAAAAAKPAAPEVKQDDKPVEGTVPDKK